MNRNFEVKKVERLSGRAATFYTVKFLDKKNNELEDFVQACGGDFPGEVAEILTTIEEMGKSIGLRDRFFKEGEGKLGDGVCALYDAPKSNLRLYCIRFGRIAVVLGNGGHKPKTIRTLQEDRRLTETNAVLREVSKLIDRRIRNRELWWEGNHLKGNLTFNFDEDGDEYDE